MTILARTWTCRHETQTHQRDANQTADDGLERHYWHTFLAKSQVYKLQRTVNYLADHRQDLSL